ncbi:MAG TPA: hypothetical protein VMT58_05270, partial [Candidatus Binataceae bacterium]|nr:hypothetical protein [Candidatus Binataceae bacterium]
MAQKTMKTPPADVTGFWSGTTNDESFGQGDGCFELTQNKSGSSIVKKASGFSFTWPGGAFAYAPVSGMVKGSAVTLKGNAFKCPVKFSGVVNSQGTELTGTYTFSGQCAKKDGFTGGTFDFEP